MENFRHNLTPVEVKTFLKTVAPFTENLLILHCHKTASHCPRCGQPKLCHGGAVSLFASTMDKVTHEVTACLQCGYKNIATCQTCEKL